MKVTCYGPRGSLPSPSTSTFNTAGYGGNTSCYYVEAGPFRIILDCGSGIRTLGNELLAKGEGFGKNWIVLLSHYHWDHIQGLPFCIPMFIAANRFDFHGFTPSGHERGPRPVVETMIADQQSNPHFPVAHSEMPAQMNYTDHSRQFSETFYYMAEEVIAGDQKSVSIRPGHTDDLEVVLKNGYDFLKVTTIPLNHPDGCLGYRIEYKGKAAVYATDNEPLRQPNAQLTKLGKDADWMLLDGQYTENQLAGLTQTFGHGTPGACVEQAKACGAKHLVIHHHDPNNDDDTLDQMAFDALKNEPQGWGEFAREGTVWDV